MWLEQDDRMLFQGDSITHAFRKPEEVGSSYRLGAGWVMMLAAQLQAENPQLGLQIENRGECGHGVENLLARWEVDCIALRPTVLNLLIGVNDTISHFRHGHTRSLPAFKASFVELLDRTRQSLPRIRLILCEPFLLSTGEVTAAWRDDLRGRQDVVCELAHVYAAIYVPLQANFDAAAAQTGPAYWLFDGIHPNAPGQWLIMQAWRRSVLMAAARR